MSTEYYINDAGAQMDKFGASIVARLRGEEVPEGGYPGEYVTELGRQVLIERPDLLDLPAEEASAVARELGYRLQLADDQATRWRASGCTSTSGSPSSSCTTPGQSSRRWSGCASRATSSTGTARSGCVPPTSPTTRTACSSGPTGSPRTSPPTPPTTSARRTAGSDEKIYLLGADHHGYVNRLKAIAACAGDDPEQNIEVLIGQLVNIAGERDGQAARQRDRAWTSSSSWIGTDAIRYSLARYPADSPLSLDGEELRKQTNDNPVFYVQYAHARTANVSRLAGEDGVDRADGFDASLLADPTESALLAALGDFPRVVAQAAHLREPHRVARYLEELAARFHKWYDTCRVRPQNAQEEVTDLHRTRLWLNDATRQVLANGLDLLGVSAPDRM